MNYNFHLLSRHKFADGENGKDGRGKKRTLSEIIAGGTGCLAEPGWAAALSIWASGTPWVVLVVIFSTVSPDVLAVTGAKTQTTRPIP